MPDWEAEDYMMQQCTGHEAAGYATSCGPVMGSDARRARSGEGDAAWDVELPRLVGLRNRELHRIFVMTREKKGSGDFGMA